MGDSDLVFLNCFKLLVFDIGLFLCFSADVAVFLGFAADVAVFSGFAVAIDSALQKGKKQS